jgi:signal transduction histidine kinase
MEPATAPLAGLRASGHLCFPYESEDERRRVLVAFVREGLERRDRCVYIGLPDEQSDFLDALGDAGVDTQRALARGALVLATQAETYLRSGAFDPEDSLALMTDLTDRALADGFAGVRVTGEASGPVPDDLWPLVIRYEALLNERLVRRPFLGICRFHAASLPAERVQDVLRTHPFALVRGEVCTNPFYERPEVVLSGDSRSRLDWQLHQLRAYNRALKRLEARRAASAETESVHERALRARDRFLSVLADELGDPLFALKREVHALGEALDETPAPERLDAVERHLRRLSAIVEQARDVARLLAREPGASGADVDAGAECDLVAVVREAARGHGAALEAAGVELVVDAPEALCGSWDREAVERLVSTFVRGAAARGAERPRIGVDAHDGGVTLTFHEGRSVATGGGAVEDPDIGAGGAGSGGGAGYTVELPRGPRRPGL